MSAATPISVVHRFVESAHRTGLDIAFLVSSTPVIGAVPSALLAIYTAVRVIDRVAASCFQGVKAFFQKGNPDQQARFQEAREGLTDHCILFAASTLGVCTLGLSTYAAVRIAFPRGIGCGGDDL